LGSRYFNEEEENMKKNLIPIILIIISISICSCSKNINNSTNKIASSPANGDVVNNPGTESDNDSINTVGTVDITEKMYVTYINEIYTNTDDYIGKNIKIEGMFTSEYYEPTKTTYHYVYRIGPGCCGNDGSMCGFEITYKGELPRKNDWIEVIGKLRTYEENGNTFLALDVSSLKIMDKRGAETVYR
jgi:putative membrane protein